jgi:hypothetical protein
VLSVRSLLSKFRLLVAGFAALVAGVLVAVLSSSVQLASGSPSAPSPATPIQHLVSSAAMIGQTDQANHQYDLKNFDTAVANNNLPKVYIDPSNGTVTATPPFGLAASPDRPPPTTTTTTTTPTTTTTQTPPPTFKPKLKSLSAKRHGKKVRFTLKIGGVTGSAGKIVVKLKLTKHKKTIAKGSGTVRSGKVSLTLRAKKTVKKGRYKLSISVTQAGKTAKLSRTLKLK